MTPSLIVPIGLPGCGKSTYGKTYFSGFLGRVVSSDQIRAELSTVDDQSINDQVFDLFHARIEKFLKQGWRVYADATNLTVRARTKLLEIAMANRPVEMHMVLFANADQAILRNARRDRVVPPEAMLRMLEQYEAFRLQLPSERHSYKTITEIRSFDAR